MGWMEVAEAAGSFFSFLTLRPPAADWTLLARRPFRPRERESFFFTQPKPKMWQPHKGQPDDGLQRSRRAVGKKLGVIGTVTVRRRRRHDSSFCLIFGQNDLLWSLGATKKKLGFSPGQTQLLQLHYEFIHSFIYSFIYSFFSKFHTCQHTIAELGTCSYSFFYEKWFFCIFDWLNLTRGELFELLYFILYSSIFLLRLAWTNLFELHHDCRTSNPKCPSLLAEHCYYKQQPLRDTQRAKGRRTVP